MTVLSRSSALLVAALFAAPGSAAALGPGTSPSLEHEVKTTLESYDFCRDAEYPLSDAERAYCPLVGRESRVCPRLPQACEDDARPELSFAPAGDNTGKKFTDFGEPTGEGPSSSHGGAGGKAGGASGRGGQGDGKNGGSAGPGSSAEEPPPPPEETKIEVPGWLAVTARVVFYLLAAAFVGAILWFLIKSFIRGRERSAEDEPAADAPTTPEETPAAPRGPIETDVDRLLARARAAAQAGDFKQAVEHTYAALLRRLEGDGLVDLHPSRTNGDYVRQLGARPDLKRALRDIATDVERMQFGAAQPSPSLFDSVYRRVMPLVGRAAAVVLLLGYLGAQSSCAEAPPSPRSLAIGGKGAPGGAAPLDTRAVFELLEAHGKSVRANRDDVLELGPDLTIVVLPDAVVEPKVWRRLTKWVEDEGGRLVVAGHRDALDDELRVKWAKAVAEAPVVPTDAYVLRFPNHELAVPRFSRLLLDQTRVGHAEPMLARVEGDPIEPHTVEPYAVTKSYPGGGSVALFADDALFKNIALAAGDNASFLVKLFQDLGTTEVEVWDRYTSAAGGAGAGPGASSSLESLESSKLGPVLLHLAAVVLLYLVYKGTRFGSPRDPRVASRRAFSDHVRAIGLAYARARASRHALGLYTAWAFERLRERFGGARHRGLIPLAEAIAQRTSQTPAQVMQVLMEASSARDEAAPPSSFRPGAQPSGQEGPTGPARDFWIMRQLESFLQASSKPNKGGGH
jgi:hypothetical protein